MTKKVLVFSSLAGDTGAAVRASYIAEGLCQAGVGAQFVAPPPKTWPLKLEQIGCLPRYLWTVWRVRPAVLVGVKSYPNLGLVGLAAKLFGGKVIFDTDDLSFAYSSGLKRIVSRWSQELFLPLADLHTFHHPNLLKYLTEEMNIPSGRTFFLGQGVSGVFSRKVSLGVQKKLRRQWGLGRKRVLIFVGHFDVACDLGEVLPALKGLLHSFPDVCLLVVGDGPKRVDYERLVRRLGVEKQVVWTGLVAKEAVAPLVSLAAAALVYYSARPANRYRVSMKVREYLAMGKPVVANDFGELRELSGYVYQSETDPEAFCRRVGEVLAGEDDGRQRRGRRAVRRTMTWERICRGFAGELRRRGWVQ